MNAWKAYKKHQKALIKTMEAEELEKVSKMSPAEYEEWVKTKSAEYEKLKEYLISSGAIKINENEDTKEK